MKQIILEYTQLTETDTPGTVYATATTFGPRTNENGTKLWYTKEAFTEFASTVSNDNEIPMYVEHNDSLLPIGKWTEVDITESSLRLKGNIFMETQAGKDAYYVMKESNLLKSVSVSTNIEEAVMVDENGKPSKDGFIKPTKASLHEVSIVNKPANKAATINHLENMVGMKQINIRELEKNLRDVGLSQTEAKAAIAVFRKVDSIESIADDLATTTEMVVDEKDHTGDGVKDLMDELYSAMVLNELEDKLNKTTKGEI